MGFSSGIYSRKTEWQRNCSGINVELCGHLFDRLSGSLFLSSQRNERRFAQDGTHSPTGAVFTHVQGLSANGSYFHRTAGGIAVLVDDEKDQIGL